MQWKQVLPVDTILHCLANSDFNIRSETEGPFYKGERVEETFFFIIMVLVLVAWNSRLWQSGFHTLLLTILENCNDKNYGLGYLLVLFQLCLHFIAESFTGFFS